MMGGRAERNEFLLLHAFNKREQICPDKMTSKQKRAHVNNNSNANNTTNVNDTVSDVMLLLLHIYLHLLWRKAGCY